MKNKPKVALVLGAGGAKGFAHIGVLQVLQEADIHFDMIVGCSIGAIIGGCYALGADPQKMGKEALEVSRTEIMDIKIPDKFGFVKGEKAERFIRKFVSNSGLDFEVADGEITGKKNEVEPMFSDCKVPFCCVATDFFKAERVVLSRGKILPAIRASFSIGGVFRPVKLGTKFLLDGGLISRVPVDTAREKGADIVIAFDCVGPTTEISESEINSYFDTINRVFFILDYGCSKDEMHRADLLVQMPHPTDSMKFKNLGESIEYGKKYATEALPKIKEVIKNWNKKEK